MNAQPLRTAEAALREHYAICEERLRAEDHDRWLACLFAPSTERPHLHALYAFNQEIARIRDRVSDPGPGEIRMQWWVDAIEGEARGGVNAHPVAHALIDTIHKFQLPRSAFTRLIEARRFDLYDDAMADMGELEAYCGHTASSLFRLASIILARGKEPGGAEASGYAGVAYALTGLLRAFPYHAAHGRLYIPLDLLGRHGLSAGAAVQRPAQPELLKCLAELRVLAWKRLDEARNALSGVAPNARAAFAPLALPQLSLKMMDRPGYQPFSDRVEPAQWRKQWAMWRF
jgi:phytoene synthase